MRKGDDVARILNLPLSVGLSRWIRWRAKKNGRAMVREALAVLSDEMHSDLSRGQFSDREMARSE